MGKPEAISHKHLRHRLAWLGVFRLVIAGSLVGAILVFQPGKEGVLYSREYYAALAIGLMHLCGAGVLYRLSVRGLRAFPVIPLAYANVLWDALFATAMIFLSYATDPKFVVLYFLNIFNAAFLLFTPGAVTAFSLSTLGYASVCYLAYKQWLPLIFGLSLQMRGWTQRDLWFSVLGKGFLFLVTAAFSAWVARTYRSRDEALEASRSEAQFLEQKLKGLLDHIEDGLLTVDDRGNIQYANPSALELLEQPLEKLRNTNLFLLFPSLSPDLWLQKPQELRLMRQDGRVRICSFSTVPLKSNPRHSDVKMLWIRDLTDIREMELQMKRREHLAAVGEVAARVAHEIRNPLTAISGAVEYLASSNQGNTEAQSLMEVVLSETQRLNGILTDFLNFTRPGQDQIKEDLELTHMIQETADLVAKSEMARDVHFEVDIEPGVRFFGDSAQLKQMLWNFLINALEAMDHKGTLRLSLRLDTTGQIVLAVSDSGPGIPSDVLPRVFDPFFSTKPKGTGLGLSVVHRIVERHMGRIEVDSVLGRGSTFRVYLPQADLTSHRAGESHA